MKIQTDTWHYRLWRSTYEYSPPHQTNLCSYVQRVFWRGLSWALLGALVGFLVGSLAYVFFYGCLWLHPLITCLTMAGIIIVGGGIWLYVWWDTERRRWAKPSPGPFVQWVRAKKQGICPLVEFEDQE